LPFYGIDDEEGRRVISWSFLGMLVGARAFEYIWNFPVYWKDPSLILDLNRGGLSEVGALSGAVATAVVLCWRNPKITFARLCDASAPPTLFSMALGRWGCFFAGCCVGLPSKLPWAVRFPYDPPLLARHSTQIYYSISAAMILLVLLTLERWLFRRGRGRDRSLITPLGLLLYSIMRLSIDPLRAESNSEGLLFSHGVLIAAMPIEALWLAVSWRTPRKSEVEGP
jgi:phosphatidylglycerol:prolipoprotein diacylglycerol transferase